MCIKASTHALPFHLSDITSETNKNLRSVTTLYQEMDLSADKGGTGICQKLQVLRIDTKNKQRKHSHTTMASKMEGDWQRMSLIEEWMEKRRISMLQMDKDLQFGSSSSSSSHSSSPGFTSSDCESYQPRKNKDSCSPQIKQKEIPTAIVHSVISKHGKIHCSCSVSTYSEMPLKSRSAALKKYKDLKTSKLPISPGGKLTRFINSMFNGRRHKIKVNNFSRHAAADDPQMSYTCSPTSPSNRSCLVKKSPIQFSDRSVKKSVRFYSTSVEYSVDIRSRNVEHSPSSNSGRKDENLRFSSTDNYRGASGLSVDEDEIDDAASNASSELFEIDHIIFAAVSNSNGSQKEDLPVFESTNVNGRNHAISNELLCSRESRSNF